MILVKKIVPFNNILTFNTDVCAITAISLEHDIKLEDDSISGVFYISGEYKITDGLLEKEDFKFELPFDIALGNKYNMETIKVDIDDFRYELVGHNELKVNIDLYIDGEILEEPVQNEVEETNNDLRDTSDDNNTLVEEPIKTKITESLDLLDNILDNKEDKMEEIKENIDIDNNNENTNENVNIFNAFNEEEKYVTYRVYTVTDEDTLDKILEKYQIPKDELAKYNDIENIKTGDKLIIPTDGN